MIMVVLVQQHPKNNLESDCDTINRDKEEAETTTTKAETLGLTK